jgi:hypothetical protein
MKIAINWFEVLLPTINCEIPVEYFDTVEDIPKPEKSSGYRTVLRSNRERPTLYYIADSNSRVVKGKELEKLVFYADPSLTSHLIEYGFAAHLQAVGFQVFWRHVGGIGYTSTNSSARPQIYESLDGIEFRCFYGFGRKEDLRWGLILSHVISHSFKISLADDVLRQLAIGKKVVPLNTHAGDAEEGDEIVHYGGILERAQNNEWHVIDREGTTHLISLDEWTLPCRTDILLNYIRSVEGSINASALSTKLQQEALTLTMENRMNTALARHKFERLQTIMRHKALDSFQLPLPGQLYAKVNQEPLTIR